MRIIIYTGKGGVGKTSVAAATALRAAAMGYKTVVISTDAAHSLSDSLEVHLSGKLENIAKNLDGIEVDIQHELETRWKEIQSYLSDFLASQGMNGISAKEMAIFPGMELMSALFYVEEFYNSKQYDFVVMDTAPTADTLRLLAFPDTANWYFDKLFHMVRNVIRVARATVGRLISTPLPSDRFLSDLEDLRERLGKVKELLSDPETTSIRLVVNPEKMVITETQRAYTYLCLYGYTVESIVINRIIPEDIGDSFFQEKLKEQRKHLATIGEAFSPLKTLRAPLMPKEVLGKKALELLADELFGKNDPTEVYSKESPMKMFQEDDGTSVLAIKLPFVLDQKVELYTRKDDLTLQVGAFKKSIALPHSMANRKVLGADLEQGWLRVRFEGEELGKGKNRKGRRGRKAPGKAP
ncbi:MAG: arsenical pump-driving ATPase [Euryarchaeota archaeon RBG_16_62_10]|nr:MAG: arsenical pump-driving ATPase [Euryarchaeota archaeon RBG_16_62_10]